MPCYSGFPRQSGRDAVKQKQKKKQKKKRNVRTESQVGRRGRDNLGTTSTKPRRARFDLTTEPEVHLEDATIHLSSINETRVESRYKSSRLLESLIVARLSSGHPIHVTTHVMTRSRASVLLTMK